MSSTIKFPVTIEIRCNREWYLSCTEPVTVEGEASIVGEIEIDSVPSYHDILSGLEYELPEGWSQDRSEHLCPKCTKEKQP